MKPHYLLAIVCLLQILPLAAQPNRRGRIGGLDTSPASLLSVQATRLPVRYRSAQWQASPGQWGGDSTLIYAEESFPNSIRRTATVRISTGDSLYKSTTQLDGQARVVASQDYTRTGTRWRLSYEEGATYDAAGRLIVRYNKDYNSSGQPTSFCQKDLYIFDNLGREIAHAWYTWNAIGWYLQDSTLTRYSNRAGIPDTTFTNSVVRKLHYTAYPSSYVDTLVVSQLLSNNVWTNNSTERHRIVPPMEYYLYESYDATLRRLVPSSENIFYHSDTLERWLLLNYHHGRRDSTLRQIQRFDDQQRRTFNESSIYDTTTHRWNINYLTISYEEQAGVMRRILYHQGTDYAHPIPYVKYDFFGPLAVEPGETSVLRAWPNPASGQVWVQAKGRVLEAELLDMNGRLAAYGSVHVLGAGFDLQALPPGTYMALLRTASGMVHTRVVKE